MTLSDPAIRRPVLASMVASRWCCSGCWASASCRCGSSPTSIPRSSPSAPPCAGQPAGDGVGGDRRPRGGAGTVEGLKTLTSSSSEQSSNITLEFNLDRNVEGAAQDVRDKVSRVRGRLPEEIEEPVVAKQDADARPILFLALSSDNHDLLQLTDIADRS